MENGPEPLSQGERPSGPDTRRQLVGDGNDRLLRGTPDDYDDWAANGAAGWAWSDVLPFFKKLETDTDFSGELHGADGPTPIRRPRSEECSPVARAIQTIAAITQIQGDQSDMNGDFRKGLGILPDQPVR